MNRLTRLRQILAEDPQLDSVSDAEEFRAELIKLELLEACRRVNEDCDALNCEEIRAILAPVLAAARDDRVAVLLYRDWLMDAAADLDAIASVFAGDNESYTPAEALSILTQIAADLRSAAIAKATREGA